MYKFLPFIALLAASVQGDHAPATPAPYVAPSQPPTYHPAPYHPPAPAYKPAPYVDESPNPMPSNMAKVSAEENADGKITSGSYQVALPDGRIQTVTYTVDAYNGFVADVAYEGTPVYPKYEPKPALPTSPLLTMPLLPPTSRPAYKPPCIQAAPAYKPALPHLQACPCSYLQATAPAPSYEA
ncbi:Putative LOC100870303 [Caligus rogercresseyi]|uniref:LOC100870303 n=1 Tax=Caligus rogercresseyi TaxID=217165 RepID=A0A7T8GNP3_CALRO|nr:Putative LOC100870303 [Caligus rogercresseyi]